MIVNMNKEDLIKKVTCFVENSQEDIITKEIAISANVVGMKIFDAPIFAFGNAASKYFKRLKKPSVIGEHFMLPQEWLPGAQTVISFFLPFTERVRKGNARNMMLPSEEWLHGRIEGQDFVNKVCHYILKELANNGYKSIAPSLDEKFWSRTGYNDTYQDDLLFTSNWSERHVAFVCGLGTFGLSKGLITKKGVAGRFGSIITQLHLPFDVREYDSVYEYCTMCGVCVKNCPANAISLDKGKNHDLCLDFLIKMAEKYNPRFGCGKCQVGVPCEKDIPNKSET